MLESLFSGPDDVLLLDEPDNFLDVPGKEWLERIVRESPKTVLLVTHDREVIARCASAIATLERGAAGATLWLHGGGLDSYRQARIDRNERLDEVRRRWFEEEQKLKDLVAMYKAKAAYNDATWRRGCRPRGRGSTASVRRGCRRRRPSPSRSRCGSGAAGPRSARSSASASSSPG